MKRRELCCFDDSSYLVASYPALFPDQMNPLLYEFSLVESQIQLKKFSTSIIKNLSRVQQTSKATHLSPGLFNLHN